MRRLSSDTTSCLPSADGTYSISRYFVSCTAITQEATVKIHKASHSIRSGLNLIGKVVNLHFTDCEACSHWRTLCILCVQVECGMVHDVMLTSMGICCGAQLLCRCLSTPVRALERTACASRGRNFMLTPQQLQMLSRLVEHQAM